MNLEGFAIHELQQAHILNQYSIDTNLGQLVNKAMNLRKFIVVNYSIERYIYLSIKLMSVIAQLTNIIDAITHGCSGSKFGSSNIYSIGTMINGSDATSQILGWS